MKDDLLLPWHKGNTGDGQIMFLNSHDRYCGAVQIKQHPCGGIVAEMEERRRVVCAEFILHACNNIERVEAINTELLATLENMVHIFDRGLPEGSIGQNICAEARAAITKAKEVL